MFCNRNTFGFNEVLIAGKLSMVQYQFKIIYHGFLQACLLSWIIHKKIKKNKKMLQHELVIQYSPIMQGK